MVDNLKQQLVENMRALEEVRVLDNTVKLLAEDVSSYEIFELLLEGIAEVDALYESGQYFIADLIMAGHIMQSVMNKVLVFDKFEEFSSFGKIVIATVEHDIHDLGKNVISDMLQHNGFTVWDIGVDVSAESIVQAVKEYSPNIVILSGMLTQSAGQMSKTIKALEAAGLRNRVRIIVGGPSVNPELSSAMGADAYSADVKECLRLCHGFMAQAAGGNNNA